MENLIPNLSFILMAAIFIFIAVFINYFIFKPVFKIIEQRKFLTELRNQESNEKIEQANKMQIDYFNKINQGRIQGIQLKEKIKAEGSIQASKILNDARMEMEQSLKKTHDEIASQVKVAREELKSKAAQLANQMTEKLLTQAFK